MDSELEQFKREINLVEYAASKNFIVDSRKTSKRNIIMRRGANCDGQGGEVIGISYHARTGHQVFNNFTKGGGGTVIDFAQQELGVSIGQVRKELRSYLGRPANPIRHYRPQHRVSANKQRLNLRGEKQNAKIVESLHYLASRGIDKVILKDKRFHQRVLSDRHSNALFPHFKKNRFCGFEKKNFSFTGFSANGGKGLWYSNRPSDFQTVVVCESAIDCISHAKLHTQNSKKTAYVSIAGQLSHDQRKELKSLINRNPKIRIVAAFDNDEMGQKYTKNLVDLAERPIDIEKPKLKDWNEDLLSF